MCRVGLVAVVFVHAHAVHSELFKAAVSQVGSPCLQVETVVHSLTRVLLAGSRCC